MIIEIETKNLKNLIDGLNNAIISLNDTYSEVKLQCVNSNLAIKINDAINENKLKEDDLDKRFEELYYLYTQLLEVEKNA